jgi:phospholipid/cholesterol/gamma-HCH transport system substrate-binding protein
MKKATSSKIKLGMFVTLGMAVFIAGIYFIGEGQQLFRSTFRISGVFKDVAGLQPGNNVRFSGINVGVVDNISIVSDSSVRVEILIDEDTRKFIKKDAVATIGSEGLMGNKILIITPGSGGEKIIENNDVIVTSLPLNLDDVFASLKTTIDNTSNITGDLAKITENIQSGRGTIGKLLMDKSLRQNFDSTVENLKEGTAEFHRLMVKANDLDEVFVSLKLTMDNTANITGDLLKITNTIQSGQGTMGKLFMDPSLGYNIDTTVIHLKEGTEGLKSLLEKAKKSWLLWGN